MQSSWRIEWRDQGWAVVCDGPLGVIPWTMDLEDMLAEALIFKAQEDARQFARLLNALAGVRRT